MNIALIGYGNVGRAFARLLELKRPSYPFRVTGIHTRHGTAVDAKGLPPGAVLGPPAADVGEFLDLAAAEIMVEVTTLNPASGEPAISHIRAAFARRLHVATANKGPIAFSYDELRREAERAGVLLRFESICMDGTPVFNLVRNTLPGVRILGFAGVLNSTTSVVIEAMTEGLTLQEGVRRAQELGVAEADASVDLEGWDSAAKAAALANVLMDARTSPLHVDRKGIGRLSPEKLKDLAAGGKTVRLVSRAISTEHGLRLRVRAEVLARTDLLASVQGTSNLLQLQTDLMGTLVVGSIRPGVEQTAYGLFSDVVDIARTM